MAPAWSERNLIFLMSLPRSGSTLLQRILAAREEIATVPESWLLLPFYYAPRRQGVFAEYGHASAANALADFAARLPEGMQTYHRRVRDLVLQLFGDAVPGTPKYFLEKTPRNALIADDLVRSFRDAKFIFLWRNPLAVAASLIDTLGRGRWNLYKYRVDLYEGLERLTEACRERAAAACSVRYEDLVTRPEETCRSIFQYLNLEFDPAVLERFNEVQLPGRMGDPNRGRQHGIATESLARWTTVLRNPPRRAWARRYLRRVGGDRLRLMGYEPELLEAELAAVPSGFARTGSDLARMAYGVLDGVAEIDLARRKWSQGRCRGLLTRHS